MKHRKRYHQFNPWVSLVRISYRLTHSRAMRHMARTVPWLRLEPRGEVWDLYWKGRLRARTHSWLAWREEAAPQSLFVIGSGPSIREQDLSRLRGEACVLLNGAVTLAQPQGPVPEPVAVMIEDARFIQEKGELLRALPEGTRLCLVGPALHALGMLDPALFERFRLYFIQGFDTHYGRPKRALAEADPEDYRVAPGAALSLNLAEGHFGCGTVMYTGVQLAFHLRVQRVYLVGFDMTNFEQPRFYETEQNAAWTGLANAYERRVLPAFRLAVTTAREKGMTIENCSHTSILPRDVLPFNDRLMPDRPSGNQGS